MEAEGDREAEGDFDGLADADGLILALGLFEADGEIDGLTDAEGDFDADGLRLGEPVMMALSSAAIPSQGELVVHEAEALPKPSLSH